MGAVTLQDLPEPALLLLDAAPVIYSLDQHPTWGPHFRPIFEAHGHGRVRLAITTVTIAEVLVGPLGAGNTAMARRYRSVMERWLVVPLDVEIAERAGALRARARLKMPDAVQAASALAIEADALVTHDRDFLRVPGLHVIL